MKFKVVSTPQGTILVTDKKKKERKPLPRYFLAYVVGWRKATPRWVSHSLARCHERNYRGEAILIDLVNGTILQNTLGLRAAAIYVRKNWPEKNKALRAIASWRKSQLPKPKKTIDQKLKVLDAKEKNWTRKLKLASTKLRKIRAARRRLAGLKQASGK